MAKEVERRYDTAGNLASVTPAFAEVGFDSTNKRILIGDGSRVSGYPAASFEDVQDQAFVYAGTAGGTADALELSFGDGTLDYSPTALVEGQRFAFKAASNNTGSVTVDILDSSGTSLGTRNVKKITDSGKADLEADDIVANGVYSFTYDGTDFQIEGGVGTGGNNILASGSLSSGASLDLTSLPSNARVIRIVLTKVSADSDDVDLWARFSSDNGSTFDSGSSDYRTSATRLNSSINSGESATKWGAITGGTFTNSSLGNASDQENSAIVDLRLFDANDPSTNTGYLCNVCMTNDGGAAAYVVSQCLWNKSNRADNAIRIFVSSGTFSCDYTVYLEEAS